MAKLVIVGCGNMGSAIIDAVLQKGLYAPKEMVIVEKMENPHTQRFVKQQIQILKSIQELPEECETVILAVKPQDAPTMLSALQSKTKAESLVISIMAGITLEVMEHQLKETQIIRCMPNTPCAIHQGMTVYCGNSNVNQQSLEKAQAILSSMGKAFAVDKEVMIDAATAISGSGPAYVFYLAEAMKAGAMKLGFNGEQAELLATQTLLGASTLLDRSDDSPEGLRKKVSSPKGTTAAATDYFDANRLQEILIGGFQAAFERSLELGKTR